MTDKIYIRPIGPSESPQSEEGDTVRLAGGMVYAHRFAVLHRSGGKTVQRWLVAPSGMDDVLSALPDDLASAAQAQWTALGATHQPLHLGDRTIVLDQPQIMGILNVTPDSFSDGGEFLDDVEAGRAHAAAMLEAGAAMVDIGGESTRPGAPATWEGDELERVLPAVEYCSAMGAAISVDTRRPAVMEAALDAGAHIINDVSALRHDPRSLELMAARGCPVVLMHAPGEGEDLHRNANYLNVVFDVFDWLQARRDAAIAAGIDRANIILDPGIGFGKSLAENLALMNALPLFHALGQPLLLGASRKRMIGALSNEAPAEQRLGGSIALTIAGMNAGVQLHRVHDVAPAVQARNVWRGMRDAALTDFGDIAADLPAR
ncbi:dihydropteroate synthase [Pontixanthobacter aestiaquae]|uniref:dihydropteroate synthase n=1 Tax=Pontixanthobacter aestiaquae TaxID=1509367 RepID=A0A844Z306_9SPHN|nr:dihydropteroate synthase [Pontixanthobacter aestiaquae]MDN3645925.1 dihydropteroate synthase [Pontixanthobacter aestiaquae]MXO83081.1 dihydropteroate synthase [Pontixanthobacter aestiaquae]